MKSALIESNAQFMQQAPRQKWNQKAIYQ